VIEATNPCAEQPLPPYGCCCLGSIDLTRMVKNPFTVHAGFDYEPFKQLVRVAVRMLDNVLDVTAWPLPEQQQEAQNKRRIGLGYTGLGDALGNAGLALRHRQGAQFRRRHHTHHAATRRISPRLNWRRNAGRFRCWMQTSIWPNRASHRACRTN